MNRPPFLNQKVLYELIPVASSGGWCYRKGASRDQQESFRSIDHHHETGNTSGWETLLFPGSWQRHPN